MNDRMKRRGMAGLEQLDRAAAGAPDRAAADVLSEVLDDDALATVAICRKWAGRNADVDAEHVDDLLAIICDLAGRLATAPAEVVIHPDAGDGQPYIEVLASQPVAQPERDAQADERWGPGMWVDHPRCYIDAEGVAHTARHHRDYHRQPVAQPEGLSDGETMIDGKRYLVVSEVEAEMAGHHLGTGVLWNKCLVPPPPLPGEPRQEGPC